MRAIAQFCRFLLSPQAILALLAVACLAFGLSLGVQKARSAAMLNSCNCHGKQLGVALQNYHDTYKCFPPAYITDADGKPMHSWRVLILPFMEEHEVFNSYKFDEPWNGPNNRKLADKISSIYRCPAATGPATETSYVAVVGAETGWPGPRGLAIDEIADGTSRTIALVEVANSGIHWMEPRDLTLDQALEGINSGAAGVNVSSHHPGGANVIWFDVHVSFLPNDLAKDKLRALLTANGREPVADPTQDHP